MPRVRRTVGVYDRPETRGTRARAAAIGAVVALAVAAAAAALYFF